MSDKELEEYINKIEPNFDSHLEKGTIEMSNEYYNLLEEKMARLINKNQSLKKQLEYLRSGEYYNQLRFENEMLQQVVDTNGVPSEVYDYIDCTHRNTELLEENQKLKKQLENCYCNRTECAGRIKDSKKYDSLVQKYENQQKEFIEYLTSYIDLLSNNPDLIEENQKDILEEILSKYKSIIGGKE